MLSKGQAERIGIAGAGRWTDGDWVSILDGLCWLNDRVSMMGSTSIDINGNQYEYISCPRQIVDALCDGSDNNSTIHFQIKIQRKNVQLCYYFEIENSSKVESSDSYHAGWTPGDGEKN